MLSIREVCQTKERTHAAVVAATKYIMGHGMDSKKTKIRSSSEKKDKYGIWPTTEFLEFMLKNRVVSPTPKIATLIESMVDFIVDKYNQQQKRWPFTDVEDCETSAMTTGHCIYVLKLYVSQHFVDEAKKERITNIIREAVTTLIADYRRELGGWKITPDDTDPVMSLNCGRFLFSYNAWFGIRKVDGYQDSSLDLRDIPTKLGEYLLLVSNQLLDECQKETPETDMYTLICTMAKAIQMLNDFAGDDYDGDRYRAKKEKLCEQILKMLGDKSEQESALSSLTQVEVSELPNNMYQSFSNNVPFDLYFAIKNEPNCLDLSYGIIKWYIDKQSNDYGYWTFKKENVTWPTCEALLVLADAHASFLNNVILDDCRREQAIIIEKHNTCDECRKNIDDYKQRQEYKTTQTYVRKVRNMNFVTMAITIFVGMCAIAALAVLSVQLDNPWLNFISSAIIIPTIIQVLFTIKIPKPSENEQERQEVVDKIDESKKKLGK